MRSELAGDDLVNLRSRADADVGWQPEQLDVAVDDPRRSLARGRADAQADLTAPT